MGQRFESLDILARAAALGRELNLTPGRFDTLRDEAIACLPLPDLKKVGRVIPRPPDILCVAFDSNMTRYALRSRSGRSAFAAWPMTKRSPTSRSGAIPKTSRSSLAPMAATSPLINILAIA